MILPIYAYGQSVLKKKCLEIEATYPDIQNLIADMWETMYNANGVGLASPQVGRPIRLFIIDSVQIMDDEEIADGIKQVFINAEIVEEKGEEWEYEEGCLSIPHLRGNVTRLEEITLTFQDEKFKTFTKTFKGINARVIQHEFDHTEGILFTELLKPLKRNLIKKKLDNIRKGKTKADYPLRYVNIKKGR